MAVVIQTREKPNQKGWWCNGTIDGYDVSFEKENRLDAVKEMIDYLKSKKLDPFNLVDVRWERVQYHKSSFVVRHGTILDRKSFDENKN